MGFSDWIYALWLTGLALQPLLVAVLVFRKTWRKFPLFTAYAVCSLVGDAFLYVVNPNLHRNVHVPYYFYLYLAYEVVAVVLALGVIYETFTELFCSHRALRSLAWLAFRIVCVVLVILGAAVVYSHTPINEKGISAGVLVVEEASRIVEVGLIMFLFLFSTAFGLHWRQHMFGIVLGLGISAAVKLATITIGPRSYTSAGVFTVASMLFFDFSLLIWIAYLLAPERAFQEAEMPKQSQLEQWNQAVMELIHQ